MKACKGCGRELPLESFDSEPLNSDGRTGKCRECRAAYRRERLNSNPEARERQRAQTWRWHLRTNYGLTPEEHDELLEAQGGGCAICGSTEQLRIDHDHVTGAVRGILCHGCNVGLGGFRDEPERMVAAAAYIMQRQGAEVSR